MTSRFRHIFILAAVLFSMTVLAVSSSALTRGDVDSSGDVSSSDARTALRIAVGLDQPGFDVFDIADMDMNGAIEPSDARAILRTSVGLDTELPYFALAESSPVPTCKGETELLRVSTEDPSQTMTQKYPALAHDFSVQVSPDPEVPPTCKTPVPLIFRCKNCDELKAVNVYGEHDYAPATCTDPEICTLCGAKRGKALGHSTGIGYCDRCHEYISELANVRSDLLDELNAGRNALKKAYEPMLTIDKAEPVNALNIAIGVKFGVRDSIAAYSRAIEVCGNYGEFAQIKVILGKIVNELTAATSYTVNEGSLETFKTDLAFAYDNTMSADKDDPGYNYQIKAITDSQKP